VVTLSGFVKIYEAPLTLETEANSYLIAAAPDMMAACEDARAELLSIAANLRHVKCLESAVRCEAVAGRLAAEIAKAKGGAA
jgi:hypothetical protein